MDVIAFNTSANFVETIGHATCRYSTPNGNGSVENYVISVGGLKGPTPRTPQESSHNQSKVKHTCQNYLQIDVLDIKNAMWKSEYIVTNGIRNRSYHSLTTVQKYTENTPLTSESSEENKNSEFSKDVMFIFGGGISTLSPKGSQTLEATGEVVKIEKGLFGYVATSFLTDQSKLNYMGLTAVTVGKLRDKVVIIGGKNEGGYNEGVQLFSPFPSPSLKVVEIDPASVRPPSRAYHSAVVLGESNEYVLIIGGEGESEGGGGEGGRVVRGDVWLLDLSDILQAEYAPEPPPDTLPAKGKAPPKGKEVGRPTPYARWQQIQVGGLSPRSRHASFSLSLGGDEYEIGVLGGLTEGKRKGVQGGGEGVEEEGGESEEEKAGGVCEVNAVFKFTLTLLPLSPLAPPAPAGKGAAPPVGDLGPTTRIRDPSLHPLPSCTEVQGEKETLHPSLLAVREWERGLSLCLSPLYLSDLSPAEGGDLVGWVAIGGLRAPHRGASSLFLMRDKNHPGARRVRRAVAAAYSLSQQPLPVKGGGDGGTAGRGSRRRVRYASGAVYDGEVVRADGGEEEAPGPLRGVEEGEDGQGEGEAKATEGEEEGTEGVHLPHGQGKMVYSTEEVYEGDWERGRREGQGKWERVGEQGREVYEGGFLLDLPHGEGELSSPLFVYAGEFREGRREGKGEMRYLDKGEVYRGAFLHSLRHGQGVLSYLSPDGQEEGEKVGQWERDRMVGKGVARNVTISSLDLSLGYFPKDLLFTSPSAPLPSHVTIGGKYTGPLLDGLPHGEGGESVYLNHAQYVGCFRHGRRNNTGRFTSPTGEVYEGKWVGDLPCGFGRYLSPIGDVYEGLWESNAYHGEGMLVNKKEGTVYVGQFKRGKKEGQGRVVDEATQQVVEQGEYVNDRLLQI